MKRKTKTKQRIRRSHSRFSLINIIRGAYENRQILAIVIFIALPLLLWNLGVMQTGYQKVIDQGHRFLAASGFVVRDILVEGREQTKAEAILAAVGVKQGESIFKCNPVETKARLDTLPWIKSATIQRRLPGTIYIRLVERQPIAIWQKASKLYLIDDHGEVLDGFQLGPFSHFLVVTGEEAPHHTKELLAILSEYPNLKKRIKSAIFIGGRRWDLVLDNKVRIKLPESDVKQAFEQLALLQKQNRLTDGHIASIDIRLPDRSFLYVEKTEGDKRNKEKLT